MATTFSIDGATIWEGTRASPRAGSISIRDGVIAAIGHELPADAGARSLPGAHILPGFVDSHSHLTASAWLPYGLDAARWGSPDEALAEIVRRRTIVAEGAWIVAFGADFDVWRGRLPHPDDLDAAAGGAPVVVMDFSLHRCLASSEARRIAGVATGAPWLQRGDIATSRGRPNGLLWEAAASAVIGEAFLALSREVGTLGHTTQLLSEARRHLAHGITACHDPCVPASMEPLLERVRRATPLRLSWSRVGERGPLAPMDDFDGCAACGEGPASAKLFVDGAHRCALCLDPRHVLKMMGATALAAARGNFDPLREMMAYRSVVRGGRVLMPYLRMDPAVLARRLADLAASGVRPRIHTVGNHATACTCNALAQAGRPDATLEHVTFLSEREIDAVAASSCAASLQPATFRTRHSRPSPRSGPAGLSGRIPDEGGCPDRSVVGQPLRTARPAGEHPPRRRPHACGRPQGRRRRSDIGRDGGRRLQQRRTPRDSRQRRPWARRRGPGELRHSRSSAPRPGSAGDGDLGRRRTGVAGRGMRSAGNFRRLRGCPRVPCGARTLRS